MTRRLLALIALLSGLAALHAPAHASRADQLACNVQALADCGKSHGVSVNVGEQKPRMNKRSCPDQRKPNVRPRLLGVLPPSLIVGVDRALE